MNDRFANSYYQPDSSGVYNQSQESISVDVRGSFTHYPGGESTTEMSAPNH